MQTGVNKCIIQMVKEYLNLHGNLLYNNKVTLTMFFLAVKLSEQTVMGVKAFYTQTKLNV